MRKTVVAIVAAIASLFGAESRGQNDWQYPDPYFGILEIEKSRSPTYDRRYRAEVRPPQKGSASARRMRWSATRQRFGTQGTRAASP